MKRAFKFVVVSGIGFALDFIIYSVLTIIFKLNIDFSNMISSLSGVTFVFFMSTKKIFATNTHNMKLHTKYVIYVLYQVLLIFIASKVLLVLKKVITATDIKIIVDYVNIVVKIIITPFTLLINYFVMKYLTRL